LGPKEPLIVWLGDLAGFHDIQGLFALNQAHIHAQQTRKRTAPTCVLLSDNGGGGIFHHLPISQSPQFNQYFFTPLSLNWTQLGHALNVEVHTLETQEELQIHLKNTFSFEHSPLTSSPLTLLHLKVSPTLDYEHHQSYWSQPS
jgi:2-succinyl-5-enolpyruvyl-6-hydroxy-3-cyclohexene-1-carboxylate synthase